MIIVHVAGQTMHNPLTVARRLRARDNIFTENNTWVLLGKHEKTKTTVSAELQVRPGRPKGEMPMGEEQKQVETKAETTGR